MYRKNYIVILKVNITKYIRNYFLGVYHLFLFVCNQHTLETYFVINEVSNADRHCLSAFREISHIYIHTYQRCFLLILINDDYFLATLLFCYNILLLLSLLASIDSEKNKCKLKLHSLHTYCHFGVFNRQHTSVRRYTRMQDGCQHNLWEGCA
jgi:hypothetical protein